MEIAGPALFQAQRARAVVTLAHNPVNASIFAYDLPATASANRAGSGVLYADLGGQPGLKRRPLVRALPRPPVRRDLAGLR